MVGKEIQMTYLRVSNARPTCGPGLPKVEWQRYKPSLAPVVELVDAADSKSAIGNDVGVQVPPGAPNAGCGFYVPRISFTTMS